MTEEVKQRIQNTSSKGLALALLATTQFVLILDIAIVTVALPSIGTDLEFAPADLSWVINAYALTFGGFLLLGGRMSDLIGRRRMFMAGLIIFTVASLAGALATVGALARRRPRRAGSRSGAGLARRAVDRDDAVPRRARSATRRSASGAPSPAAAARQARSSAASSPTSSPGRPSCT